MTDPLGLTLIPIITGGISSTVQIVLAIVRFWQAQKDRRIQNQAYQSTAPASTAAQSLQSLMGVQSSFWEKNPALFQALGNDAARFLKDMYSKSNGYLSQLAQFAAQIPEKMDWKSASEGLGSVNRQLREMFAQHLGKVISKLACGNMLRRVLLPKDIKEKIARENANLLMQAQNDLGMLMGQMKAGEEGTRRQIEWYEQQAQRVQPPPSGPPPGYYQGQQPMQQGQQLIQYPPQQEQPRVQPQVYQSPPQQLYQQQQAYPQPPQGQPQYYVPVYQTAPQGHVQGGGQPRQDDKAECIIS